ncbi:c-type cytochrome [Shimia abyssi]|uniref:Cytochrome c556 n=1 Tax=Shimia abyssi TaxID=1662395 RepID=A0A2P8FKV4_9RHOB|nr:cytochrome c [Shimia abyssi]PSL22332.1 cytochrome c556 [Shimia abyssi]
MPRLTHALAFTSFCAATAAFAHNGVKDPDVMARMNAMSAIAKATGTLSDMARGKTPLHQAKARMARDTISLQAAKVPALFENQATDPKSEAAPAIWDDWTDFTAKADQMKKAALALDFTDRAALRVTIRDLGASCSACHKDYRIEK